MELDKQALDRWLTTEPERGDYSDIASELVYDDDTCELDDGRVIRLRVEPDDINPFEFYGDESYGKVAPVRNNRWSGRSYRPVGFTGNAEKIWPPQNSDPIWWEPPKDGPKRGTPEFKKLRALVADIAAFGLSRFVLELCDGKDAYSRSIVRRVASVGGIEPDPEHAYRMEIVTDLLYELLESEE